MTDDRDLNELRWKIKVLTNTLGSLMTWMAQSANSPISLNDAERLLKLLHAPFTGQSRDD
jgi:hypothetical protein